ncbi:MAG TPA: hypothetical protein PLB89_16950 [Flavobacteriales bacterium]|nr:hypothetical protein [Flavobacteriales bacterium]
MSNRFYHATTRDYSEGQIVDASAFSMTEYVQRKGEDGMAWVDDLLEAGRPDEKPSRRNCCYTFKSASMCIAFLGNRLEGVKLYEVELDNPYGCPMCLVGEVEKSAGNPAEGLVAEYWTPSKEWNQLEYLATKMTIIKEVRMPPKSHISGALSLYFEDQEKAKRLYRAK